MIERIAYKIQFNRGDTGVSPREVSTGAGSGAKDASAIIQTGG